VKSRFLGVCALSLSHTSTSSQTTNTTHLSAQRTTQPQHMYAFIIAVYLSRLKNGKNSHTWWVAPSSPILDVTTAHGLRTNHIQSSRTSSQPHLTVGGGGICVKNKSVAIFNSRLTFAPTAAPSPFVVLLQGEAVSLTASNSGTSPIFSPRT
jgi:hypothetical protein